MQTKAYTRMFLKVRPFHKIQLLSCHTNGSMPRPKARVTLLSQLVSIHHTELYMYPAALFKPTGYRGRSIMFKHRLCAMRQAPEHSPPRTNKTVTDKGLYRAACSTRNTR
eukprot:1157254-Pelagomonas_calceolata.AAC.1